METENNPFDSLAGTKFKVLATDGHYLIKVEHRKTGLTIDLQDYDIDTGFKEDGYITINLPSGYNYSANILEDGGCFLGDATISLEFAKKLGTRKISTIDDLCNELIKTYNTPKPLDKPYVKDLLEILEKKHNAINELDCPMDAHSLSNLFYLIKSYVRHSHGIFEYDDEGNCR